MATQRRIQDIVDLLKKLKNQLLGYLFEYYLCL